MLFLEGSSTKLFATDAGVASVTITGIDLGGLFCLEEGLDNFKIACETSGIFDYHIYASGVNSEIVSEVEFSLNKITWSTDVTVAGLNQDQISDVIYFRLTPAERTSIGDTSFLIRVDEEEAT
jgi:hypothetical protein